MRNPSFQLGYRPALDGLRGIAILAVLAFHSRGFPLAGGFIGVDLFFVLSGFLITSLIIQERSEFGRVNFRAFYARRALRLLPAMLGLLAALWAATLVLGGRFATGPVLMGKATVVSLLYVPNWVLAFHIGDWPYVLHHIWSLAIEEQFYIFWPAILTGCLATRRPVVIGLLVSLGLAGAVTVWRIYLTLHGAEFARRYFATDTRSDGLLVGCALGLIVSKFGLPRRGTMWVVGGVGLAAFTAMLFFANNTASFMYLWGWTVVSVAVVGIILGSLNAPTPARILLECAPLVGIGRISYGLYLWHWPVYFAIHRLAQLDAAPGWAVGAAELGLSLLAALASYYVIERPALRLKARFDPRPRRA